MEQEELIRLAVVISMTGLSRSKIYDLISKNEFPKQVKLGNTKSVTWVKSEIYSWNAEQIARRDSEAA